MQARYFFISKSARREAEKAHRFCSSFAYSAYFAVKSLANRRLLIAEC